MIVSHILLAIAWIFYCTLHSILAGSRLKLYLKKYLGHSYKYYRTFYNLLAVGLLVILLLWLIRMPSPLIWNPVFLQHIVALIMTVIGLVGMSICLRKYFLTSVGFRDLFYEGGNPTLVIDGLHRIVRHPLYLCTFIFIWGLFLFFPTWSLLITNVIITVYTLIGISFEENKLVGIFGKQYEDYTKSVPRIIPRLMR
jgi:methanethiol S-methyltransferase